MSGAEDIELWIVGAGPAGLILADACAARGLRVGVVAPAPRQVWAPNYALWLDDAQALGVEACLAQRWTGAEARFAAGPRVLDRGYALLDGPRYQSELLGRCEAAGVAIVPGSIAEIVHDDEGVCLRGRRSGAGEGRETSETGADDLVLRARLVVDASGHTSNFVTREPGPAPAYQVAWGELLRFDDRPAAPPGPVTFMDWSDSGAEQEAREALPPTFLYALPMADGRVFVEETVLAARPPGEPSAWFEPLAARLHRRLDGLGLGGGEIVDVERCVIAMGGGLPRGDQRTLAFGAAAGMVHPATGYLLANVLRRGPRVADALARELANWVGPGAPSRRVWDAIWTADEVRAWRLYGFGLEVICELDRAGLDHFFSDFFDLADARWRPFVSATAPTPALMRTMLRYFASASGPIRSRLAGALFGREGRRMVRGFGGLER